MRARGILIRDRNMRILFQLLFYGEPAEQITLTPGGGDIVARALRRAGVDPASVFFTVWDVFEL